MTIGDNRDYIRVLLYSGKLKVIRDSGKENGNYCIIIGFRALGFKGLRVEGLGV